MNTRVVACAAVVSAAVALAGCGSSSSTKGSGSSSSTVANAGSGGGKANVAAAKSAVAQYTAHPSAFPVNKALPRPLPAGTTLDYLQTSPPIAAQLADAFAQASKVLGVHVDVVQGGSSSSQAQAGLSTILQNKPDAILLPSLQPSWVTQQLRQATSQKIPVVATGIMNTTPFGIKAGVLGHGLAQLAGKLLADWVVANKGASAQPALYVTPELDFSSYVQKGYDAEMAKVCPGCKTRVVNVPLATFANTAPSLVVSDLQAHPSTNVAVFAANEAATGLPVALQNAGIKINIVGFGPNPANLQDIEAGKQSAGLGLDFPDLSWTMMDEAARLILGAPLTPQEQLQMAPIQFLTANNLKGNVSQGWTGYPDFAKRFESYWKAK